MSSFYDSLLRLKHAKVKRFVSSSAVSSLSLCITICEIDQFHISHSYHNIYGLLTFFYFAALLPKGWGHGNKKASCRTSWRGGFWNLNTGTGKLFGTSTRGQVNLRNYTEMAQRQDFQQSCNFSLSTTNHDKVTWTCPRNLFWLIAWNRILLDKTEVNLCKMKWFYCLDSIAPIHE